MNRFLFMFLPIVAEFAFSQSEQTSPTLFEGVFLSPAHITTLKERVEKQIEPAFSAFQALQKTADSQLQRAPHAPENWYVPGFYTDAEGHEKAKSSLQDDANAAYQLALCYRMTDKPEYAQAAARLIDGWASRVKTLSTKDDSTLSFSYHFPALIFAANLIQIFPGWPQENQQRFKEFVRNRALPMNTMDRDNNWGNWGLTLVMASAAYLKDDELFRQGVERWKEFIEKQIADDGHLPREVNRSEGMRGIWYTHFALMPQTLAAEIALVNGVDLYEYRSPGGHTLRQAFERAAAWSRHPETFPYYKGNPKDLEGTTYIGYFEILNTHWPNADASAMLKQLRPLSAEHCATNLTFTHGNSMDNLR